MSFEVFLAFVLATAALALLPGPIVSLIVANGTSFGTRAALTTVAGSSTGLAFLAAGAALGMSSLMALMSDWFDVIRWVGAGYLVWLGAIRLWRAWKGSESAEMIDEPAGGQGAVVVLARHGDSAIKPESAAVSRSIFSPVR